MLTKLAEITEVAKHRPKEKFTSLAHLINVELLRICHDEMDGKKAVGIDKVTKEDYSLKFGGQSRRPGCPDETPSVSSPTREAGAHSETRKRQETTAGYIIL